ncbi:MAG: YaaA family protein [Bacteroidales bacterium]|nr:YaaA family protein [Bacteroidales bacterium]MCM1147335.1 YaaA family protein [Bacteroidales bacterium]MCM1206229.1 YaaA family protein [Bacillota bacterium]MCM1510463.1 YaaA family protein [Clostridium sp.]
MQILLANAKIMINNAKTQPLTEPVFQNVANMLAADMSQQNVEELAALLGCNHKIAHENWKRYQNFFTTEPHPAIMSYNGQAYKHLKASDLNDEELIFAQKHLWITCFLYGLLRPMDGIVPYRMEHNVRLPSTDNVPLTQFWKDKLTDILINSVKADDNVLIHLSTEEYEHLFDWQRVRRETTVIQPLFYVRQKDDTLKMQAVWAKACRGAMVRFILHNRIKSPDELSAFSHEGFEYNPNIGETLFPHFVR